MAIEIKPVNSNMAPASAGGYSQAIEVSGSTRTLYISGQIPVDQNGNLPETFAEQAECAWSNVKAQLNAANMTIENLVKITIFLSDRKYNQANRDARAAALDGIRPALTVVIADIFDEKWLLEIEGVAEA